MVSFLEIDVVVVVNAKFGGKGFLLAVLLLLLDMRIFRLLFLELGADDLSLFLEVLEEFLVLLLPRFESGLAARVSFLMMRDALKNQLG